MIGIQLNDRNETSLYAAQELEHFLQMVLPEAVAIDAPDGDRVIELRVQPAQAHEVEITHQVCRCAISGQSPQALLHGVYHFLERVGYTFTATGPVAPDEVKAWPDDFELQTSPLIKQRGIRQHINFPMDISCLPLNQARQYVRNLARLKMNAITFHLYPNQGWLRFEYKGCRIGMDDHTTLYYSQHHPTSKQPLVAMQSQSRQTWFIPELEPHYRTERQQETLRDWLRAVMETATLCGMTVIGSIESISPAWDKQLTEGTQTPTPELYAEITAELALAVIEHYPQIDQIEIISAENESSWCEALSLEEALALVQKDFAIPADQWPRHVESVPGEGPDQRAGRMLVSAARQMQVQARAIELLREGQRARRLGGRSIATALYTTLFQTVNCLGPIVEHTLPADVAFALLPAYSARRVARNVELANLSPQVMERTRLYSWCEFDGLMYLFQNECQGLYDCIQQATRDQGLGRVPAALLCNHWRTAENELAITYLGQVAYSGMTPDEFYGRYFCALAGKDAAALLSQACEAMAPIATFSVDHLFNLGFCFLGCWSLKGVGWSVENIGRYRDMLGDVAARIEAALPRVGRQAGLERCKLMLNRLEASRIHCEVVARLRAMRDLVGEDGKLPAQTRELFCGHAQAARELVEKYLSCWSLMLPDRMSEGMLVSYELVMPGVIDKVLEEYIGTKAPTIDLNVQGPPSPLGQIDD